MHKLTPVRRGRAGGATSRACGPRRRRAGRWVVPAVAETPQTVTPAHGCTGRGRQTHAPRRPALQGFSVIGGRGGGPPQKKVLWESPGAAPHTSTRRGLWRRAAASSLQHAPHRSQYPPVRRRLAGCRPFKSPGSFAWPHPLGDTAGAGGPVPRAPGSLFLSSPEPGLRSSNWDSEPGLFLALARLQEGIRICYQRRRRQRSQAGPQRPAPSLPAAQSAHRRPAAELAHPGYCSSTCS
ncbi:high mobility group protein HMG-I/HMG-Y isoform X1 [Erinaceus europaeus]|uniref:High mobility group protein HMG-I/HMG-Y isoform X1 n=1 Tax=Erinaceus europaeus TaxID=9365 RepID=A0ABM3X9X1_ERIEU|nr:high mobility group protein HMG-I/HMG-Y isoform X1 [Erinaceus europaeus]